jgi:predicted ferric reductase
MVATTAPHRAQASNPDIDEYDRYEEGVRERAEALLLFVVVTCSISAGVALGMTAQGWLPGLKDAMLGPSPTAYFQLSRSSGIAAYGLLWLSMMFGLLITNRLAKVWPGGPEAFELHRHASLLSLGFTLFHVLVLLGDPHIHGRVGPLVTPFGVGYRTGWVAVGQVCLYLLVPVALSFYVRKWLGKRTWRMLHFLTFALFIMAMAHSVMSGPDTSEPWAQWFYWSTSLATAAALAYRLVVASRAKSGAKARAKARQAQNAGSLTGERRGAKQSNPAGA